MTAGLREISTGDLLCLIFLLLNTVSDVRKRRIWWPGCAAGALAGLLVRLSGGTSGLIAALFPGLLPGLLMTGFALIAEQEVGLGDGLVLLACGTMTDPERVFGMVFAALCLAGIYGLFLLLFRKKDRKESFPFIPFLLAGMILTIILG